MTRTLIALALHGGGCGGCMAMKLVPSRDGMVEAPPQFSLETYQRIADSVARGKRPLSECAQELGVHRLTLRWRMKSLGLPVAPAERPLLTAYQERALKRRTQGRSLTVIAIRLNRSYESVRTTLYHARCALRGQRRGRHDVKKGEQA